MPLLSAFFLLLVAIQIFNLHRFFFFIFSVFLSLTLHFFDLRDLSFCYIPKSIELLSLNGLSSLALFEFLLDLLQLSQTYLNLICFLDNGLYIARQHLIRRREGPIWHEHSFAHLHQSSLVLSLPYTSYILQNSNLIQTKQLLFAEFQKCHCHLEHEDQPLG